MMHDHEIAKIAATQNIQCIHSWFDSSRPMRMEMPCATQPDPGLSMLVISIQIDYCRLGLADKVLNVYELFGDIWKMILNS